MPRVVVVGASFAGLYAAKGLRRAADVVLIDASDEWEYTPSVHEVLGGRRKPDTILASFDEVLPGVEFVKGVAVAAPVGQKVPTPHTMQSVSLVMAASDALMRVPLGHGRGAAAPSLQ